MSNEKDLTKEKGWVGVAYILLENGFEYKGITEGGVDWDAEVHFHHTEKDVEVDVKVDNSIVLDCANRYIALQFELKNGVVKEDV